MHPCIPDDQMCMVRNSNVDFTEQVNLYKYDLLLLYECTLYFVAKQNHSNTKRKTLANRKALTQRAFDRKGKLH
jgi:hypothetical protein